MGYSSQTYLPSNVSCYTLLGKYNLVLLFDFNQKDTFMMRQDANPVLDRKPPLSVTFFEMELTSMQQKEGRKEKRETSLKQNPEATTCPSFEG